MDRSLVSTDAFDVRAVTVRPVRDAAERRRWDAMVREHHYLSFNGFYGRTMRHVAVVGDRWVALVGWTAGAFKVGARDRFIGWDRERQFRRLKLIANNARFVILCGRGQVPNLASRVLGLSLRRLSDDMRAAHGHPVLMAETFVDPSRFTGTCYRAANWRLLGRTLGFTRLSGNPVRWRRNGQPKEVYVYMLQNNACEILRADEEPAALRADGDGDALSSEGLRSMYEFFKNMADFRKPRGKRYSLACYLTIMVAARLGGHRGVAAFGEFAAALTQERRRAVGGFFSPSKQMYTVPAESSFHYILDLLEPDVLEDAISAWSAQCVGGAGKPTNGRVVAVDGKDIRGAAKQLGTKCTVVSAMDQGTGAVIGQLGVPVDTNEMPVVRQLIKRLHKRVGLKGRIVTMDAMHVQNKTAKSLLKRKAHYVYTAVKGNQPTLLDDLRAINWEREARWSEPTKDYGHGRFETRICAAVDLDDSRWDGYCELPGRRQAFMIKRRRRQIKSGKVTESVTVSLTSLGAEQASPDELLHVVRSHWGIENKVHYPRDFTYDEDRCRNAKGNIPRNLTALSNAAISIVRLMNRFPTMPKANRHFARETAQALDAVMTFTPQPT